MNSQQSYTEPSARFTEEYYKMQIAKSQEIISMNEKSLIKVASKEEEAYQTLAEET